MSAPVYENTNDVNNDPDIDQYEAPVDADDDGDGFDFEPPVKKTVPPYARSVPRRSWILAGVSFFFLIVNSVMLATIDAISVAAGRGEDVAAGFFSPWRVQFLAQTTLWLYVLSAAGALYTYLAHVRDREQVALWMAARAKVARVTTAKRRAPRSR